MNVLLLGSTSLSRQMLLKEALIPFEIIGHTADEESVDRTLPLEELLKKIAQLKMDHVNLPPNPIENMVIFILTADSMGQDAHGTVHGKPKDKKDAREKIQALTQGSLTGTAFCLDKRMYYKGNWILIKRIEKCIIARYTFVIPENWIDRYLEHSWAMIASGAIAIELYGNQFLKSIEGSYSTIVGLPMFELREALEELDFFDK